MATVVALLDILATVTQPGAVRIHRSPRKTQSVSSLSLLRPSGDPGEEGGGGKPAEGLSSVTQLGPRSSGPKPHLPPGIVLFSEAGLRKGLRGLEPRGALTNTGPFCFLVNRWGSRSSSPQEDLVACFRFSTLWDR